MKKIILLAGASLLFATAAMADPVEGTWKSEVDDNGYYGHIEVVACGDKICGTLIESFNGDGSPYDSENVGKAVIWDMVAKGNGKYGDGIIHSFDRDKDYSSTMVLDGTSLAVKGCAAVIFCRTSVWTRVE